MVPGPRSAIHVATKLDRRNGVYAACKMLESHKVATWVTQSRNIPNLGRAKSQQGSHRVATWVEQSRNMNRAKSQHGSRKVAKWVAKSRKIANLGRVKSQHSRFESQWSQHTFLGRTKSHKCFGCSKSQDIHFESQWLQYTFFRSRKVATYLVWVAQSLIKFLRSRKVATHPF